MFRILGAVLGIAALVTVVVISDPPEIWRRLAAIPSVYVFIGLGLVQVQIILSAVRWRFTAQRLRQGLSLRQAVRNYYLSSFLNQTLPGGMAGDAVRALRHRGELPGGWKVPALVVVLERAVGQGVFLLIAGVGLVAWPLLVVRRLPDSLEGVLSAAYVLVGLIFLAAIVLFRFPPRAFAARMASFKQALYEVFVEGGAWKVQSILGLFIVGSYIGMYMLASVAVGAPLPALASVTVVPLCMLMMLVPATVAGWGAREAAAAGLWPLFGYAGADGVAASIFYGVLSLAGAAPGLVVAGLAPLPGRRATQEDHDPSSRA
ncbi:uncharacterized membrane protein YbhN (UPF0104 family) [Pseudorhizobium tarimense]|uniref:Uncharacterized membrane protein YbhN (UPF0104 family) n=1 Tax=Pseudorhizobium tarimense TaxID=1079109 RepID=A0ABV2H935_9HYPH|nr:lysylphosphatidylglycerol synthase transmembrane domain-containing protein [Pseudorhizobium tarimense]MCJ8520076.1 flippase-like domain-containing protein [Pseudorhizobium tarimense]